MIEVSKSGRFMLVGDSIVNTERLMTVEMEETVSDITEAVEGASCDSLSDMFKDIKQKITSSATFGIDGGGGRKVVKVGADQVMSHEIANKQLRDVWEVLKIL